MIVVNRSTERFERDGPDPIGAGGDLPRHSNCRFHDGISDNRYVFNTITGVIHYMMQLLARSFYRSSLTLVT